MALWVNRSLVPAPRNGTNSHTVEFTPASAGSLLLCVVEGAVTSTTPSGWTLPSGGSAVNNTGLYVWWKIASAGESSLTTTHNGSNYPAGFVVYEFPAGSSFVGSVSDASVLHPAANPPLSGLSGTNLLFGVVGAGAVSTNAAGSTAWSGTPSPTEDFDLLVVQAGSDGYLFSIGYAEDAAVESWQPTGAVTATGTSSTKETLTFAVNVAADSGGDAFSGSGSFSATGSLTAVSTPAYEGSVTLSAIGALAGIGVVRFTGVASFSGTGSLVGVAVVPHSADITLRASLVPRDKTAKLVARKNTGILQLKRWDGTL